MPHMTEILLIRHGQASFGEANYDRLSTTGIAQSRRLGEWLRDTGTVFDVVYTGERERQRDTATLALAAGGQHELVPLVCSDFNELDADRLMQHAVPRLVQREPELASLLTDIKANRDGFRRLFERVVDEWVLGGWGGAGIGTWEAFSLRVLEGLAGLARRHAADAGRIAVFTSGGPITAAIQALGNNSGPGLDWRIANTSITRLSFVQDRLVLGREREMPHLATHAELVTHL